MAGEESVTRSVAAGLASERLEVLGRPSFTAYHDMFSCMQT